MEAATWQFPAEAEDDEWALDEDAVRRVREHAPEGCLMCAVEEWDDE